VERNALIIKSSKDYGSPLKRHICVDMINQHEIFECIRIKRKKFWYLIERTLTQPNLYWECYEKEEINHKTKNTTAFKFLDADNTRIYCKEIRGDFGNYFIICSVLLTSKKVKKNNSIINNILETISSYDYNIIK
jgi:hypothetical protein